MNSRRRFLQTAAVSAAALSGLDVIGRMPSPAARVEGAGGAGGPGGLSMGIAGYTFAKVPLDQGIAMMKRVGIDALSIKDFYLPLDSTADVIHSVVEKFLASGIRIYAAGVIYMKTEAEVDRAFEYAKTLGVGLIIGVPNPELLSYTEKKVKAYNIRIAIHNHGPEDKLYPSPVNVYDHIKDLDSRMGLCLDIGHAARAGADPVKVIGEYGPRIFDLHMKDLAVIAREAHPIELGRGVLDIVGVMKALRAMHYSGYCSIEHEMDMSDPLPGIAESAGFFRGVLKTWG